MPLDGVSAKCLAAELDQTLRDARVDRIFQPDRTDILFVLRQNGQNLRLVLSANPTGPRMHLTGETRENPGHPPMFCMLLRKHLLGARIASISTPGYERLFNLRFQTVSEIGDLEEKTLVVELMGRHSNIILLSQDGRIHDAIVHVDAAISRVREVMPARTYIQPPQQHKLAPEAVLDLMAAGRDWLPLPLAARPLEKALLEALQGFSPQLCHEVADRAGLDGRLIVSQLTPGQSLRLNAVLGELLSTIVAGRFEPSTFYTGSDDTIPVDFHALPLGSLAYARPAGSLSQAMDLFYLERVRQNALNQKRQSLGKIVLHQLEHARRKLQIHENDCADGAASETWKRQGDLILANLRNWQDGRDWLDAIDYYSDDQATVRLSLDPGLNPTQMAQRLFRRYAKARTRGETGARLAREDRDEIAWLESLLVGLAHAEDHADFDAIREEMRQSGLSRTGASSSASAASGDAAGQQQSGPQMPGRAGSRTRRHRQAMAARSQNGKSKARQAAGPEKGGDKALPPRRYTSSDGLTILVGRNNLQNDQLTLRQAQKDDLWLHVQKMPGTHVIIRADRQKIPEQTLQEAAEIAAWFSRAVPAAARDLMSGQDDNLSGRSDTMKVAVDYCPVSHVRKPSGARPGKVIYEHYQTILVTPKAPPDHA